MITSKTVVEKGSWKIKKLERVYDDEFGLERTREMWYVLKRTDATSTAIAIPFDQVKASGSLINLIRDGQKCATLSGIADGVNTYSEETEFPKDIFDKLKEIGPW